MYKLLKEEMIDEVSSKALYFIHEKTRAQVLVLSNDDENKAFGIGFKTIPEDSTGVAHIVEHSVLSGSRKYRTKEPFMDLIKSSQQTFLNAMTYPDKTIYPVSSRNEKDFYNLMDVYLDAVFYPRMYEVKEIFEQEGWHYEMEKDSPLSINGVVYNEMKGVYSDPQSIVSDTLTFNLHPNSTYGVDSGGSPKEIPNLTYENFLNFHKKFYHPSNSYIYLYGNMDYEEVLKFIEDNYLNSFEFSNVDSEIKLNQPLEKTVFVKETYAATQAEVEKKNDYVGFGWCVGKSLNPQDLFMRNFLSELLVNSDSSPIKQDVLSSGFAEDVWAENSTSLTLDLSIVAKNTGGKSAEEFRDFLYNSLENIVSNGIDKDLLLATFNKFEFAYREGGGIQKAIIYYIRSLNTWLYGENPIDGLKALSVIENLRNKIDTDFFEEYIKKHLLENKYSVGVQVVADADKNEIETNELKDKLETIKSSMSDEEVDEIISNHKNLVEYQLREDTEEDKNTIPSLEISDIKEGIEHIESEKFEEEYGTLLFNPQPTNGISYLTISFPAEHISIEDLPTMNLLSELFGKVSTDKYHYSNLDTEIYKIMGGFGTGLATYKDYTKENEFKSRFEASIKTLDLNFEKSIDLAKEILLNSKFDDKKRIKELVLLQKSYIEAVILQSGHSIAAEVVKSYFSKLSAYNQISGGFNYYFYLADLVDNFDSEWDNLSAKLKELSIKLINASDVVVNLTSDDSAKKSKVAEFLNALPKEEYSPVEFEFTPCAKNQGFTTSANVNYVSKGYNLKEFGVNYSGIMPVIGNILSADFLHNQIRAKGGAYGAGVRFSMSDDIVTYSYRDPNLEKTVEVYDKMSEYIDSLNLSEEDLKNYIIGTMNAFDPLLGAAEKGSANFSRFMTNLTEEMVAEFKEQALNTKLSDIKALSSAIKQAMDKNYVAAIGSKEMIEASDLFKEKIELKR
ncbi:insulinase family protein [Peptoniphilus asaccharolyticus]